MMWKSIVKSKDLDRNFDPITITTQNYIQISISVLVSVLLLLTVTITIRISVFFGFGYACIITYCKIYIMHKENNIISK